MASFLIPLLLYEDEVATLALAQLDSIRLGTEPSGRRDRKRRSVLKVELYSYLRTEQWDHGMALVHARKQNTSPKKKQHGVLFV